VRVGFLRIAEATNRARSKRSPSYRSALREGRVKVTFTTPAWIEHDGKLVQELTFSRLFRAIAASTETGASEAAESVRSARRRASRCRWPSRCRSGFRCAHDRELLLVGWAQHPHLGRRRRAMAQWARVNAMRAAARIERASNGAQGVG
jgi:hypothetical protein